MSAYPEQEPLLNNKDYEYGNEVNLDSLINEQLRKGFIVKVYSILLIQILTTHYQIVNFTFPKMIDCSVIILPQENI